MDEEKLYEETMRRLVKESDLIMNNSVDKDVWNYVDEMWIDVEKSPGYYPSALLIHKLSLEIHRKSPTYTVQYLLNNVVVSTYS